MRRRSTSVPKPASSHENKPKRKSFSDQMLMLSRQDSCTTFEHLFNHMFLIFWRFWMYFIAKRSIVPRHAESHMCGGAIGGVSDSRCDPITKTIALVTQKRSALQQFVPNHLRLFLARISFLRPNAKRFICPFPDISHHVVNSKFIWLE